MACRLPPDSRRLRLVAPDPELFYPHAGASAGAGTEDKGVDLASEADFALGPLRVSPSTREITGPHGREVLEPRVMMVLAVLAAARGHTVSRDALLERCWGGVIVGDDAVNRVIARLRKLAAGTGAFEIETITKVGYRLTGAEVSEPAPAAPADQPASRPKGALSRQLLVPGIAAVALLMGGFAWWVQKPAPQVAPGPATSQLDPGTRQLISAGREAILEHVPQRVDQGVAMLREAVVRSPQSAEAWGALALGYSMSIYRFPHDRQPDLVRQVNAAADKALSIDPNEPLALAAKMGVQPLFRNWYNQEQVRIRVEQLIGKSADLGSGGRYFLMVGRMSDVLAATEVQIRRDPTALYPRVNRAQALWALGRVDEADRETQALVRLFPGNYLAWFHRLYFLMYSGQLQAAKQFADDRTGWPPDIPQSEIRHAGRMVAALADPKGPAAEAILAEYRQLMPQGRGYMENGIRLNAALGRTDEAFAILQRYMLSPDSKMPNVRFVGQRNFGRASDRMTELMFIPPVDRLHGDPRFMRLLADVGLVDYWRRSGTRPDFCDQQAEACRKAGIPAKARALSAS